MVGSLNFDMGKNTEKTLVGSCLKSLHQKQTQGLYGKGIRCPAHTATLHGRFLHECAKIQNIEKRQVKIDRCQRRGSILQVANKFKFWN
jgi:hypothetical protein